MTLSKTVKTILETHIRLIEEEEWDMFFERIQEDYIPSTVNDVARAIEHCGIFPLKKMTFIPEGYYLLSELSTYDIPPNIMRLCYKSFAISDIKSIHIPSSIQEIGESAFESCDFLHTVTMDYGVLYIGDNAFYNCDELESVYLPKSLVSIGHNVFNSCDKLTKISYEGTMSEWKTVRNHEFITEGSYISNVICSDGVIEL